MIERANDLLAGTLFALSAVITILFLRFWRRTRDPLFALFAASFALDGAVRVASHIVPGWGNDAPQIYWLRLLAYALIAAAIAQKNRMRRG